MRNPVSRFSYARSSIDPVKRSQFSRSHDHKTTLSAGLLYPLMVDEVLPGDTYSVDMSSVVRMSTPIHPVMDNCYLDVYWFFTPNRILWDHWKEFMGENPRDPYVNPIEYSIPRLLLTGGSGAIPAEPIPAKSLLDYLGLPAGTSPRAINALPVRGFCTIWNEWFRDQNLQDAINVSYDDAHIRYANVHQHWDNNNRTDLDSYVVNAAHGGDLPPVNKYHDYFTSALVNPQKGDPVAIPLSGFAPVYAYGIFDFNTNPSPSGEAMELWSVEDSNPATGSVGVIDGKTFAGDQFSQPGDSLYPNNLVTDLSRSAGVYATINDLRHAYQLQRFLEAENVGGSRYREVLKAHFGVNTPDASQQIPEFLGGKRIPINISQVLQTSSTDEVSPQGNTAAYSLTSDKFSAFTKSFTEHGYLFCVACIRTEHTYSQGIEKMWSRFNKLDFYFPEFANIGNQPIYNKEIYNAVNPTVQDLEIANQIFGYQEAWAEYRYKPSRVSAEFSPTYAQSLDVWHYGDYYTSQPYLSSGWIRETRSNIDRTLAVNDLDSDQFICDFYFKMNTTRVMPVYSVPGLSDHH